MAHEPREGENDGCRSAEPIPSPPTDPSARHLRRGHRPTPRGRHRPGGGAPHHPGPDQGYSAPERHGWREEGFTSLRLHYRHPGVYVASVLDVRAGLAFLKGRGCSRVVLMGHSFGGAVVIAAGTLTDQVVAVVALSPQTYGAQGAVYVAPRPLLLVHGLADTRLPPSCARQIYQWAEEPKELVFYPGAGHGLRECKGELHALLYRWIPEKLGDA